MAQLRPYLFFNRQCEEAMNFYKSVLGGELKITKISQTPMAAQMPPEMQDSVMHAELTNEHLTLFGSDMAESAVKHGNDLSICLVCDSVEEIKRLYSGLQEGGAEGHALKEEYFGTYGDLVDKYGNRWMLQYDANQK